MPLRYPIRILAAGLVLGLIFDRLLAGRPLGVSFPLFIVLVLLALTLDDEVGGRASVARQPMGVHPAALLRRHGRPSGRTRS